MTASTLLLVAHALATVALTGLIWFVQVVHYPLFLRVGPQHFTAFAADHVRLTSRVVAPLMLTEVATAGWLALTPPAPQLGWITSLGFALLLLVWSSTALLQVPCHRRLEREFDPLVVRRLVATNWVRTLAWTTRAVLALYLVVAVGGAH